MPAVSAEQLNAATLALQQVDGVETVDCLVDERRLVVVVGPDYNRVPPRVLRPLLDHDLGVEDISPQSDGEWLFVRAA